MPVYMFDKDGNFQVLTVEQVSAYLYFSSGGLLSLEFQIWHGLGCYLLTSRLMQCWWC